MSWAPMMTLAEISSGGLLTDGDWVESKDQDPSGSVRLTQLADVGVGEFRDRSNRWMRVDQAAALRCTHLRPSDVLIARMPDPLGRACLVPPTIGDAVTVVDVSIVRIAREDVDPRYAMWLINAPQFHSEVVARQSGTTRKRISRKNLARLELPIPSLQEQHCIVDILEDHLSRLGAGRADITKSQRHLEVLKSSILLDLIPDVDRYPSNWTASTVGAAGDVGLGRQRHPDWHSGENMRPYLRVANVFEDRIDTSDVMEMHWPDNTFERFKLHPGDVLLNEGQSPEYLGRPAIYQGVPADVAFTNSILRFKASDSVDPEFALLVFRRHMRAGRFKRESRITTNIAHLSARRLKEVEFPIPPMADQRRIVDCARERLDAVERLGSSLAVAVRQEANLRRSLLSAAFSGRFVGDRLDAVRAEQLVPV